MIPTFDQPFIDQHGWVAGVDEAGRGPWAGPIVVAVADIGGQQFTGLDDSKKLKEHQRERLYEELGRKKDVRWAWAQVSARRIDKIGIDPATRRALKEAYQDFRPPFLMIDEMSIDVPAPHQFFIKGDTQSPSIAAASIVAKVVRDRMMLELHKEFPQYGFDRHKGYGTELHRKMIVKHGLCRAHRRSYKPIKRYLGGFTP